MKATQTPALLPHLKFRFFTYGQETFFVTKMQGRVLRALVRATLRGQPWMTAAEIRYRIQSTVDRPELLFRNRADRRCGTYCSAWYRLVEKKGDLYRLAVPVTPELQKNYGPRPLSVRQKAAKTRREKKRFAQELARISSDPDLEPEDQIAAPPGSPARLEAMARRARERKKLTTSRDTVPLRDGLEPIYARPSPAAPPILIGYRNLVTGERIDFEAEAKRIHKR